MTSSESARSGLATVLYRLRLPERRKSPGEGHRPGGFRRLLGCLFPYDPGEAKEERVAAAAAAIWVAVSAAAVWYALVQPVWSVVDEGPHFGYVELVAEKAELPRAGDTVISESVLAIGRDRQWGWQYPRDPSLRLEGAEPPAGLPERDVSEWVRSNLWRFNYEAIQPPLYYLGAALVYLVVPGSTIVKVYAIRVFSALLGSLVVVIAYRLARRIAPGSRLLLLGAPASFLVLQGFLLNTSQVTNDSLAATLGGLVVLAMVAFWQADPDELTRPRLVVGGAVLGAALLTKSVLWYLAPMTAILFIARLGMREGVRKLVPVVATSAALFLPWLARNVLVYGEPTGQSRMGRFLGAFFPAPSLRDLGSLWDYAFDSSRHMLLSYIWGEPTWVWAYQPYNRAAGYLAWGGALAGWVLWALRRRATARRQGVVLQHSPVASARMQSLGIAVASALAGYLFMLVLPLFGGIAVVGRYMYPVSAPIAVATVFGLSALGKGPRLRLVVASILAGTFLVLNVVNLVGWGRSGLATSRVSDGLSYLEGATDARTRWYFGPGRNEGGFVDLIYLFNPNDVAASVNVNYYPGGKTVGTRRVVVMPREGVTINTRFDRGGGYGAGHQQLGVVVDADIPVMAGRGSFFFVSDRGWTGGSVNVGQTEPTREAFFPAGRVGEGVSQVLGLLNPFDREARVSIEYVADGRSVERTVVVPPRASLRVDASFKEEAGGLREAAAYLSTVVRSSEPIVVERQLYYSLGEVSGGDSAAPAPLRTQGVFPVVFSGVGYHPTLVVYNPAPDAAKLWLDYLLPSGERRGREVQLAPGRSDIDLDVGLGAGIGVVSGVYVLSFRSSHEVAAELETFVQDGAFSDGFTERPLGGPARRFAFPFSTTNPDFRTEIVLYNPAPHTTTVRLEYYQSRLIWLASPLEAPVSKSVVLAPGEIRKIDIRSSPEGVSATKDTSVVVVAEDDIYVGGGFFFVHSF